MRRIADEIVKKNFEPSEPAVSQMNKLAALNGTVNDLQTGFKTQMAEIELIRAQNKYVQESVAELRALVDKAKSLEGFRERDITFKAFFASLEQISLDTVGLQATAQDNLKTVNEVLTNTEVGLADANNDLASLELKTGELKETYAGHDAQLATLRQKCTLAEARSANLSGLSERWSRQVASLQGGLVAFEMTQIYEEIAHNLNEAYESSLATLQSHSNQTKYADQLQQDTEILKGDTKELLDSAQAEVAKKARLEAEVEAMLGGVAGLAGKRAELEGRLGELEGWIEETVASDEVLAGLETELSEQQVELEESKETAEDLVGKINTLDSLRNEMRGRGKRSVVDYDDEDTDE